MDNNSNDILQQLQDAEMILIGLGEEFDDVKTLQQRPEYAENRQQLKNAEKEWFLPALNRIYGKEGTRVYDILCKFAESITDKNYFVVSTSTNDVIREVPWREGRLVMPCGGSCFKQCIRNCGHRLTEVTKSDWTAMNNYLCMLSDNGHSEEIIRFDLGSCPDCGAPLILNNIYAEKYDENGYLEEWKAHTGWLQKTLNRRLLILELGVGMQYPTVIRWPFEKIAFYNQKASFYRVNETLCYLTEELKGKGTAISQNAIAWLENLC